MYGKRAILSHKDTDGVTYVSRGTPTFSFDRTVVRLRRKIYLCREDGIYLQLYLVILNMY